jgi:hypothetical protein
MQPSSGGAARERFELAHPHAAPYTARMRIVGTKNRTGIELDPAKAYRRGRMLDAMLRSALPARERGVSRGSHQFFNRLDAERQRRIARRTNRA